MVENHRWCSLPNFNLRAHFLNLGGLLIYRLGETWNCILMLRGLSLPVPRSCETGPTQMNLRTNCRTDVNGTVEWGIAI